MLTRATTGGKHRFRDDRMPHQGALPGMPIYRPLPGQRSFKFMADEHDGTGPEKVQSDARLEPSAQEYI